MNLTLRDRSLRLRVTPDEFESLRRGETLGLAPAFAGRPILSLEVFTGPEASLSTLAAGWRLVLPADEIDRYAPTLPRRDGLRFEFGDALVLEFEVDLRPR